MKGEVWGQLMRESLENGCNCCFIRPVILLPPLVVYMVWFSHPATSPCPLIPEDHLSLSAIHPAISSFWQWILSMNMWRCSPRTLSPLSLPFSHWHYLPHIIMFVLPLATHLQEHAWNMKVTYENDLLLVEKRELLQQLNEQDNSTRNSSPPACNVKHRYTHCCITCLFL